MRTGLLLERGRTSVGRLEDLLWHCGENVIDDASRRGAHFAPAVTEPRKPRDQETEIFVPTPHAAACLPATTSGARLPSASFYTPSARSRTRSSPVMGLFVWDALRAAGSAVSTTLGNSVVGWADRQSRQRRLRRPPRADLLLALLATRLSAIAYVETQSQLRTALRSQALSADVPGGLKLLHFRQQKAEEDDGGGMHPQWYLCRGAPPRWTCPDGAQSSSSSPSSSSASVPTGAVGSAQDHNDFVSQDSGGGRSGDRGGTALYLVFRGTWSASDVIRDLCVEPEDHEGRGLFHSGFLKGVREDPELQAALLRALRGSRCQHLYVFGHSLGGSLAMCLVSAGLVPNDESFEDPAVTVVAIGAPPCQQLHHHDYLGQQQKQQQQQESQQQQSPLKATEERAPEDVQGVSGMEEADGGSLSNCARYLLVVNDCDVVPRLLGSPMPVSIATMLAATCSTGSGQAVMKRNVELLKTMQQYSHPRGTDALLLRDGSAKHVPQRECPAVLHLHEALSPNLLDAHGCDRYTNALEIASAMAEAFEEGEEVDESEGTDCTQADERRRSARPSRGVEVDDETVTVEAAELEAATM